MYHISSENITSLAAQRSY